MQGGQTKGCRSGSWFCMRNTGRNDHFQWRIARFRRIWVWYQCGSHSAILSKIQNKTKQTKKQTNNSPPQGSQHWDNKGCRPSNTFPVRSQNRGARAVAQLVECLPRVFDSQHHIKLSSVVCKCNASTQEAEAEQSEVQGQPWLQREFKSSLYYKRTGLIKGWGTFKSQVFMEVLIVFNSTTLTCYHRHYHHGWYQ